MRKRRFWLGLLLAGLLSVWATGCQAPLAAPAAPARPWIGITATVRGGQAVVSLTYVQAVQEAGGVPVILPPVAGETLPAEYLRRLDGLVLTGGRDVPPEAYGEKPHPTVVPLPKSRWDFERRLIARWRKTDKPLLGVCLGAQMTNVGAGGSLVQDIPSQIARAVTHRKTGGDARHEITIEAGSRLRKILGAERAEVTSNHHQAVRRVGAGLRVVARSQDGVIEALESRGTSWVLLVQWHPERMDRAHRRAIYGALVRASRRPR